MKLFLMDEARRKKIALWAIITNLAFLHIWASILIYFVSVRKSTEIDGVTIRLMFDSIMWGIGISLFVLISDKAIDFIINKFGGNVSQPMQVKETVTRTVIPAGVNDVNIQAQGNVNVEPAPSS